MALTPTVTKISVVGGETDIHYITFNLVVNDGVTDVIDKDFTVVYKISHDTRAVFRQRLIDQMQKEIDVYKNHKTIDDSAELASDITTIQTGLVM